MKYLEINSKTGENPDYPNERIADFLFKHLEEYGDDHEHIMKAIEYSQNAEENLGGFTLVGTDEKTGEILGVVVINETNMSGYIPENILVYIAVNGSKRGKGYGKKIMKEVIDRCNGDIALHVEKDNPARFLYEKLGFRNPYLEMRLKNE